MPSRAAVPGRVAVSSLVAVTCRSVPVVARVEKPPTSLRGRKAALTPAWSPLRQAAARVAQAASDTARHNCCACAPAWQLSSYSMGYQVTAETLSGYSMRWIRVQRRVGQVTACLLSGCSMGFIRLQHGVTRLQQKVCQVTAKGFSGKQLRWIRVQHTRASPKGHGISSQVPAPHPVGGSLRGGGSQVVCAPQQLTLTQPSRGEQRAPEARDYVRQHGRLGCDTSSKSCLTFLQGGGGQPHDLVGCCFACKDTMQWTAMSRRLVSFDAET